MAPDTPASEMEKIGTVIARSLAFLCLQNTEIKNGTLFEKAQFLAGLGLTPADAAGMLGTTAESVRVQISKAKSTKGKKRAKEANTKSKAKRRTR